MGSVFEQEESNLPEKSKTLLDELRMKVIKHICNSSITRNLCLISKKLTPLSFFGDTNIGSRPVKRSGGDGLKFEDLRAIPFVGSWR
jgi:phosphoenolpyruvate carboxylase